MENSVFITNNSDIEFKDGYNGQFFDFKKGKTVQVPETVAKHVFGWGDEDKEPYLARLGWIKTKSDIGDGIAKLEQFEITTEEATKNHVLSPVVESSTLACWGSSSTGRGEVRSVADVEQKCRLPSLCLTT